MTVSIENWLLNAQGRCVERAEGEFYVGSQSAAGEPPISIWVQFKGMTRVRLFSQPDGWGIGLDDADPIGIDMGPSGRTIIRDMTKAGPFSKCEGTILERAAFFTSEGSPRPVGVSLNFASGEIVVILNRGDELVVDSRLPRDAAPGDLVACSVGSSG